MIGTDTLVRIADPGYYGGLVQRDEAIAGMLGHSVRFLVFGRLFNGDFQQLGDRVLPASLLDACTGVDEAEFRMDLSSTRIRRSR